MGKKRKLQEVGRTIWEVGWTVDPTGDYVGKEIAPTGTTVSNGFSDFILMTIFDSLD
jgi:hypothetical protein